MSEIDKKLIYNLLSIIDILKYLDVNDKKEFSSCCKAIYYKSTRIKLKNLKFGPLELRTYIYNTQKGLYYGHDSYEPKLDYFDTIVNKYKKFLIYLKYCGSDYFIIEYFSQKFSNLSSLLLGSIVIPKIILKNIINNLPNLRSLYLVHIIAVNSKVDPEVTDFDFSKCLKKLTWVSCSQIKLDNTDYLNMRHYSSTSRHESSSMLDIPLYLVNTLKYLDWHFSPPNDLQLFNKIITNNPELTSLTATLKAFNSYSFKLISNNPNLNNLVISLSEAPETFHHFQLSKLFNIKTLELSYSFGKHYNLMELIVEHCPNSEKLKLQYFVGCDNYFIQYIKCLKNLKVLSICGVNYSPNIFDSILPESNLEELNIDSNSPLSFNFNNFVNLKYLNCIKNVHEPYEKLSKDEIPNYKHLKDWRIISHHSSTNYWKIK